MEGKSRRYSVTFYALVEGDCSPREAMEAARDLIGAPEYSYPQPTMEVEFGQDKNRAAVVEAQDIVVQRLHEEENEG